MNIKNYKVIVTAISSPILVPIIPADKIKAVDSYKYTLVI